MSEDQDKPATKQDVKDAIEGAIKDMRTFVLDRETALIWKVVVLQMTLIGAIAGAQWLACEFAAFPSPEPAFRGSESS